MKIITFKIFFFSILLLFSCGKKATQETTEVDELVKIQYPITIDFEKATNNIQDLSLSQIASDITYTPLETTAKCLIKNIKGSIQATKDHIYIPSSKEVFQFTKEGKFVRQIGKSGQGPGEYNYVRHLVINEPDNRIYILSSRKIIVYTLDGEYTNEIRFRDNDPWQFTLVNDTLLATYYYNGNGQEKDRVILYNTKGDSINSFAQYDRFALPKGSFMLAGLNDRYLFSYEQTACLKEYYNDTLFVVSTDELKPRYILQMGKYSLPVEQRFERMPDKQKFFDAAKPYMRADMMETINYVFIPYSSWGNDDTHHLAVYDKEKQNCFTVTNGNILNDIDKGFAFYPYTTIGDNTLLAYKEASGLIEEMGKNPDLKEHPILRQVKEDDNPVLMIVSLK